jgi:hypothetical protein
MDVPAQETPPATPLTEEQANAAAAIQAPALPGPLASENSETNRPPTIEPPMPGQVAAPTSSPTGDRIPDEWVNGQESNIVPSIPSTQPKVTRSTSTSGQFIVHGPALKIRSAVARRCEDVAEDLRRALRDREPWALPVVVHLRGPEESPDTGSAVSTRITEMDHGGFHLQVTVLARKDLRLRDLQDEIMRVLLAERILRNQKAISSKRERLLPDWVFTGVTEAARYRERNRPSTLFAILFESGKIYSIEEIIEASPVEMDSLSKAIYETSCCALILALLDQQDGAKRFGKFLGSLASDSKPERELLNQWFPSFAASPSSLNKWWALQLAELAQPSVAEPMGPEESYAAIKSATMLEYQARLDEAPPSAQPDLTPPTADKPKPVAARTPAKPTPPVDAPATEVADAKPAVEAPESEEENQGGETMDDETVVAAATGADGAPMRTIYKSPFGFLKRTFQRKDDEDAPPTPAPQSAEPEPEPEPMVTEAPPAPEPEPDSVPAEPVAPPPAVEETMAAKEAETNAEVEDDKPRRFNLLKLFRKKDKDAQEGEDVEASDEAGEETSAIELNSPAIRMAMFWISPGLADLTGNLWRSTEAPSREVFLKFLRKKKKEGEAEESEETEDEASEAEAMEPEEAESPPKPPAATQSKTETPPKTEPAPTPKPAPKPKPKPDVAKIVPKVNVRSPIDEYRWMMRRDDRGQILQKVEMSLGALETRVDVTFRSIVLGYKAVVQDLKAGKTRGIDDRLKSLASSLEAAKKMSSEVRAHVDWYEASNSAAYSGLFDDYLSLPETIRDEVPDRSDPISVYLDALEEEFSK